jgi:hypothetical protein
VNFDPECPAAHLWSHFRQDPAITIEGETAKKLGGANSKETHMNTSLLALSILPIAFSGHLLGQAGPNLGGATPTVPAPQILERIEESILEIEPDARKVGALPSRPCSAKLNTIRFGLPDNFSPVGVEPLFLSPTARAVWGQRLLPFDFASSNRVFVVSMNLGQTKFCGTAAMKLKAIVKVKGSGAPIENAEVITHLSNGDSNSSGLGPVLSSIPIRPETGPAATGQSVELSVPLSKLNEYIFQHKAAFLEIVVKGGLAVDFVTVTW